MTPRILTSIAAVGAALAVGVPTAWGVGEPYRDHGDATQAKIEAQSSTQPLVIVRDHGDASQAKLDTQSSTQPLVIVRDHGDATQAKLTAQSAASVMTERIRAQETRLYPPMASRVEISKVDSGSEIEWPQVGFGLGIGLLLALGLGLTMRAFNVRPFAH